MKRKGYTVIEIVIAMVMIAIVMQGISIYLFEGLEAWLLLRARNMLQSEARVAASRMLDQFRNIPGTASITIFTSTECAFTDRSGTTQDFKRSQSGSVYYLNYNGTSLTDHLASNGLEFSYLDVNGSPTASRANIRSVRFTMRLKYGKENLRLQSASRLRVL